MRRGVRCSADSRSCEGGSCLSDKPAMDESAASQYSGLTLAYMGDAVYELLVIDHLVRNNNIQPWKLHKMALDLLSAKGQSEAVERLLPLLTEKEHAVYLRGRNAKNSSAKRADPITHSRATGLESLFGYLHLTGDENRISELFHVVLKGIGQPSVVHTMEEDHD